MPRQFPAAAWLPAISLMSMLALTGRCAHAGEPSRPIAPDRPDFVESSDTIGKGRVQLETSFLRERERDDEARTRTLTTPTLLRVGLGDELELRIESEGRTVQHGVERTGGESGTLTGYADASLGLLWHLADGGDGRPALGVLVDAELPTGSRSLRGRGVRPMLRLVGEWELPGEMQLGLMPGIALERREEEGRYTYGLFGAALEKAFGERLHGVAEIALPRIASSRHGGVEASAGIGAVYLLSKDCAIDTMFSRGLNHRSPYASWTVGVSVRL